MEFNDRRPTIPAEQRVTKGYAARWHGGSSYREPNIDELEHFPSKSAARFEMQQRRNTGHADVKRLDVDHTGAVRHLDSHQDKVPDVDESSYMDLHPIRRDGTYDPDVFHRLQFGKRGGVKGH